MKSMGRRRSGRMWIGMILILLIGCMVGHATLYAKDNESNVDQTKSQQSESESSISLSVLVGYDGNRIRLGRTNRLIATVTNKGDEAFDGTVSLYLPADDTDGTIACVQQKEIVLAPDEISDVDLSFLTTAMYEKVWVVVRDRDGAKMAEQYTRLKSHMIDSLYTVGVLDEKDLELSYIMEELEANQVNFSVKDFPEKEKWLECIDILVIGDVKLEQLSKQQMETIRTWVQNGGTVVLGYNGSSEQCKKNLSLLGLKGKEEQQELFLEKAKGDYYPKADVTLTCVSDQKGSYEVFSKTLSLKKATRSRKAAYVAAMKEHFGVNATSMLYADYEELGYYDSFINEDSGLTLPDFEKIVIVLILYICLITIVLRVLLKRKDKLEYSWIAIPGCAIVFIIFFYVWGMDSRIRDLWMSYGTVVEYEDGATTGEARTNLQVNNASNESYTVNIPKGVTVLNNTNLIAESLYWPEQEKDISDKVILDQTNSTLTFNSNAVFDQNAIYGIYRLEREGVCNTDISYKNHHYEGSIENQTGVGMKDAFFIADRVVYYLGDIDYGETVQLDESTPHDIIMDSSDVFENPSLLKWLSFGKDTGANGRINIGNRTVRNYFYMGSMQEKLTEPKLLYTTDQEDPVSNEWNVSRKNGLVLSCQKVTVKQPDLDKGCKRVGDLLSSMYSDDGYLFLDIEDGKALPGENVTATCSFGELDELEELYYEDMGRMMQGELYLGGDSYGLFDGEIQMYNFDTGAYETVLKEPGDTISGEELKPYINKENSIKFCFVFKDRPIEIQEEEQYEIWSECMPTISAKIRKSEYER